MKNQYVGDIGDFTKLGILRAIRTAGMTIGVNWYLTPDDGGQDGRHTGFLSDPCNVHDEQLFHELKDIVNSGNRNIKALENLLADAKFYGKQLEFDGTTDNEKTRSDWQKDALEALGGCDIVFMDPDNGLMPDKTDPYGKKGNKYVLYEEVSDFFKQGSSVIVYNHRDRSDELKYVERFTRFNDKIEITKGADIFWLRAFRFSVRDYVFILHQSHSGIIRRAISKLQYMGWDKYLSDILCRCRPKFIPNSRSHELDKGEVDYGLLSTVMDYYERAESAIETPHDLYDNRNGGCFLFDRMRRAFSNCCCPENRAVIESRFAIWGASIDDIASQISEAVKNNDNETATRLSRLLQRNSRAFVDCCAVFDSLPGRMNFYNLENILLDIRTKMESYNENVNPKFAGLYKNICRYLKIYKKM
jgi:hypothetical protein